jgi:hypothetical protein
MMNKLPFLKGSKWPRMAKPTEEKEYGFSEDDDLCKEAINELLDAWDAKDHIKLIEALKALLGCLKAKGDADVESQQSPS